MPQQGKAQYVQGWFVSDPQGPHPEHPIVIPPPGSGKPPEGGGGPIGPGGPVDPGYGYPERPVDPGYGISIEHPAHPIVIPPLVGIWPPPGHPAHPIVIPPPNGPIYIEGTPDKPITSAPGTLNPDLPRGSTPMGTVALLVEVVGVPGKRWLTYATEAQPK